MLMRIFNFFFGNKSQETVSSAEIEAKNTYKSIDKYLREYDYIEAAESLGCEVAVIKAVAEVEASGKSFDSKGRLKILWEPHLFYRFLKQYKIDPSKIAKEYPQLCYPKFIVGSKSYSLDQHEQLKLGISICEEAAYQSISMGMFQICGFNYKVCNQKSPKDMYLSMSISERNQLEMFIEFIKSNKKMWNALKKKDFLTFSLQYNGPKAVENGYPAKIEKSYKKFLSHV